MIKRPPLRVAVVLEIIAILVLALLYNIDGTGFAGKALWDWLDLLIVPLILAIVGIAINTTIRRTERQQAEEREQREKRESEARANREREQAEKRAQVDREIADDRLKEQALQTYLDRMSELLLKNQFEDSDVREQARVVARARTLTTLKTLDSKRKGVVLSFLHESGLIAAGVPNVDLKTADFKGMELGWTHLEGAHLERCNFETAQMLGMYLEGANFTHAYLVGASLAYGQLQRANLTGAFLRSTNLWYTNLEDANFDGADLEGANFSAANLRGANITEAQIKSAMVDSLTILPDGSHPAVGTLSLAAAALGQKTEPSSQ